MTVPMARTDAVIDVGSNTVSLLVARCGGTGLTPTHTERVRLSLAREIEENEQLSKETIAKTADVVRHLVSRARAHHAGSLEVIMTSPGRQAENGAEAAAAIAREAGVGVRILSPEEEAELAFAGAVAVARPKARLVAVVDLGGASTELAVGRSETGPAWSRSVDLGALSLTTRLLASESPDRSDIAAARAAVAEAFAGVVPPLPEAALVVGGSARALRRVIGRRLERAELDAAARLLPLCPPDALARTFRVSKRRAPMLLATCLILAEVQRRLVVPLAISDGSVREGALLLTAEAAAA